MQSPTTPRALSILSLALSCACALPLALPHGALAQSSNASANAQRANITDFSIEGPERVRPGDELQFTLRGTPRATASVSMQGVAKRIALRETSPGVYEGNYVLRRADQLRGQPVAQAHLLRDKREVTRRYDYTQVSNAAANDEARDGRDGRNGRDRQYTPATCAQCGRVIAVSLVEVPNDSKNIIGSVAGGVLGGVLGHQVGGGTGKDLATVIGAVGGAYAGNRIQNNAEKRRVQRVDVRLDNGQTQSFDYADDPQLQAGALVRVDNGVLVRR